MKLCGIVNNGKNSPRRVHVASATIFLMHPCAQKRLLMGSLFLFRVPWEPGFFAKYFHLPQSVTHSCQEAIKTRSSEPETPHTVRKPGSLPG